MLDRSGVTVSKLATHCIHKIEDRPSIRVKKSCRLLHSATKELPRFIKDEFDAFLECGILSHGFLRLRCAECGLGGLLAFSCQRRSFCPSCGARRMSHTSAHQVDHVIPHVPVRQWVLPLPIPLRVQLAGDAVPPQRGQRVLQQRAAQAEGSIFQSHRGRPGAN